MIGAAVIVLLSVLTVYAALNMAAIIDGWCCNEKGNIQETIEEDKAEK